jgi:hypothetical protein
MATHLREPEPCTTYVFPRSADADLKRRIQAEFREMPGMRLSGDQAARLWTLDRAKCDDILSELVDSGFLRRDQFNRYALAHSAH